MGEDNFEKILCPICEQHYFEEKNDYAICPVCGWENDGLQFRDHTFAGGANELSVNQARLVFYRKQIEEEEKE